MLTLYIVRHGKSSWDHPGSGDLERPLLEKAISRTKKVGDYLIERQVHVDLILSSHAVRARETAIILAHRMGMDKKHIRIEKAIYTSDEDDIYDLFLDLPESVKALMVVGHNPTLTRLANRYLDESVEVLPTSGLVGVEFDTNDWSSIIHAPGKVKLTVWPKMLP